MPVVFNDVIAVFDDSFQPTGNVKNEGISLHVEMKKLRHELRLVVEGPEGAGDALKVCLEDAALKSMIAAVAASFIGIGTSATTAAWSAASQALKVCLGDMFELKLDDRSEWITWWT